MYLSGNFKKYFLQVVRHNIKDFNAKQLITDDFLLKYDGNFQASLSYEQELENWQNLLVQGLFSQIHILVQNNLKSNIYPEVTYLAAQLKNLDSKILLITLECLYELLNKQKDIELTHIKDFTNLITFFNTNIANLSQIDFEIAKSLFLANLPYQKEDILNYKLEHFKIKETTLSAQALAIYKLGEFIAPERLKNIHLLLEENQDLPQVIIYLLLRDENQALNILNKQTSLDTITNPHLLKLIKKDQ